MFSGHAGLSQLARTFAARGPTASASVRSADCAKAAVMCLRLPACVQKQQQQHRTASTSAKDTAASSAETVPSRAELREQYKELAPLKTNRKPKRVHIADYILASKRGDGVSILVACASPQHAHAFHSPRTRPHANGALFSYCRRCGGRASRTGREGESLGE